MSAGTRTAPGGPPGAGTAGAGGGPPSADRAGRVLRQLTVLPAVLAMAWLLAGLPLLLLGAFTPLLMLVISVPLAALLVTVGTRWLAARPAPRLARSGREPERAPWWTVAALVLVAVAFGADQAVYHSQQIIVQRDPASYIQFANWIARHGSLPIPQDAAAFGGSHGVLSFYSPAFDPLGHAIVPQFMAGLPITLAGAFWAGGTGLAVAAGAVLGACGVLALGGLIARLAGPRWAPLGALVLALSLPEQFTSRSTYSEPLAQVLFLGGLCLVIDSLGGAGAARRGLAALGGLAIGLTLLVRIDGASDMLPLIPYCGLLLLQRRPQALPLIAGVTAGAAYGAVDGVLLSRPYLHAIKGSLLPLVAVGAVLAVVTSAAVLVLWRRGLPEVRRNWLPNAAAALALAITTGLIIRPYLQTVHGQRTASDIRAMTGYQLADHLPVDPTRLYYEISLHWVFWYLGIPAVILATLGAAIQARRCLKGQAPAWTLPLLTFSWIITATLLRPSITPDQPWASRRLVPGVLPGFIILALWAVSWLLAWLRQRGTAAAVRGGIAALLAAALALPAAQTTFGITDHGGHLTADGLAFKTTYAGEVPAVRAMCAAIPGDASVLIISPHTADQLAQVVRGMCGVPTAALVLQPAGTVRAALRRIRGAGRRPVILALTRRQARRYAALPRRILALRVQADEHALTAPPRGTSSVAITVWMGEPAAGAR
jgi:hypothetical protein